MLLIIAEKKNAAYAYAQSLSGIYEEFERYLVGKDGKVYTWAQGYLYQFKDPGEIKAEWKQWSWQQLPIILDDIPLEPIPNQLKQLEVIKELCKRSSLIINGMDAGPSGEDIFRQIISQLKINKPIKRLWTGSLQTTAIRNAFNNLKAHEDFDKLGVSVALHRKLDYLLGINTSRAMTLSNRNTKGNNETLAMGRLISSVLSLVANKEQEQDLFEAEEYFTIKSEFAHAGHFIEAVYSGPRIIAENALRKIEEHMQHNKPTLNYEDKESEQYPPLLPNHTKVLVMMHQRYKMRPHETNKHLESLYLKGLISYPRTSSQLVTADDLVAMKEAYTILSIFYPNLCKGANLSKLTSENARLVGDIDDHHAIIPTAEFKELTDEDELNVYRFILECFFLQFQNPVKTCTRKLSLKYPDSDIQFSSSEKVILDYGWKGLDLDFSYDEVMNEDEIEHTIQEFSNLEQDALYDYIQHQSKSRMTKPPSSYTEGTLLKQMENVSNFTTKDEYKAILKKIGLGTSATRAETIKKLQDIKYLALEKQKLYVTDLGKTALKLLDMHEHTKRLRSVEMTGDWELELEAIRNGAAPAELWDKTIAYISDFVFYMQQHNTAATNTVKCMKCADGHLITTAKTYKCDTCTFFIWRKQYNKNISMQMLIDVLKKGKSSILTFTNKEQKKYKAQLKLSETPGKLDLIFENKNTRK